MVVQTRRAAAAELAAGDRQTRKAPAQQDLQQGMAQQLTLALLSTIECVQNSTRQAQPQVVITYPSSPILLAPLMGKTSALRPL